LVISDDSHLGPELQALGSALAPPAPTLQFTTDFRQGLEAVRSRPPTLVVCALPEDWNRLRSFVEDLSVAAPQTPVAVAYHPAGFGSQVSESELFLTALRFGVRDFLRRPVSAQDFVNLWERLGRTAPATAKVSGRILTFLSNKGGVGKSTLAVNVACELAKRHPDRVLLVDASLQVGVCASLLDLQPETTLTHAAREYERLDETLLRELTTPHACGLHLLAAPADAVEGAELNDEVLARVLTLARRTFDYVIVDTFPLLDRNVLTVLDLSDRAFVVLENVVPTLLGIVKLLEVLIGLGLPREKFRLLLNRFARIPGSLPLSEVAARLQLPIDHVFLYDNRVISAANLGRPSVLGSAFWFSFVREVRRFVAEIESGDVRFGSRATQ